jgi:malate synthase
VAAARLRDELGAAEYASGRFDDARALFETVALAADFPEFLTLPGYEILEKETS